MPNPSDPSVVNLSVWKTASLTSKPTIDLIKVSFSYEETILGRSISMLRGPNMNLKGDSKSVTNSFLISVASSI